MRVAALYDIHGNLPALEAVLSEITADHVDWIIVGGDVLPGPMPRECLQRLFDLELPVQFIRGNGDREVLAHFDRLETDWYRSARPEWQEPIRWTAEQLTKKDADRLRAWPDTLRLDIPPIGEVLFCHATPRNDTDIFVRTTPEETLAPLFGSAKTPAFVCGHTHMQFDRKVGKARVVNAGSVGMPFGEPGADWLLIGPGFELRHTRYDLAGAADRIRATSYPQAGAFAEHNILHPPSAEQMLTAYARVVLK